MADETKDTKEKEEQTPEAAEEKKETPKAEEKTEKEEEKKEEKKEEKPAEDASEPAQAESDAGEEVEVPEQFKDLVEKIESLSVLELNELVGVLEKKFGVSASAMVMAGGGAGDAGSAAEEKDEFNVELTGAGDQKIQVIKAVKEALALGLKEAKDLVDGAPVVLKEGVKKEDAEAMKKAVEEAGGSVELK